MHGIALPRTAAAQFTQGKPITRTQLNSGDLIFFKTRGQRVSHVGIYMGNGLFIHSPNNRKSVQTESLDNPYYKKHYVGARRYWSSESR
jgi:cell wall-associated NlpC family hydrolase